MQIDGTIDIDVPRPQMIAALHDPKMLEHLLLNSATVTPKGPGAFDFKIERETRMMTLRLPGTLTVTELEPEQRFAFEAKAAHMLAGTAELALTMTLADLDGTATRLSWTGTMDSSGLARQLIKSKEDKIDTIVGNMMKGFKWQVQRAAAANRA